MTRYLVTRLGLCLITVVVISVVAFLIITLPPGDFVDSYAARQAQSGAYLSSDQVEALRASFGADQPIWEQYARWAWHALGGDFGLSLTYNLPVTDVIGAPLLYTLIMSVIAQLLTYAMALPIGIYSALKQYSVGDYAFTVFAFLGLAIPSFLLALVVMYGAYELLGWSIGGLFSPEYESAPWSLGKVVDLLLHLAVPCTILAIGGTAYVARVLRANLLDELSKPYVTTARAKGLSELELTIKHPARVAANPLISSTGYVFPQLVSGGLVVSVVMGLPTVGPLLVQALLAQDLFLASTIILLVGVMTVVGVLISDILLAWVDPRIRFG